MKKAKKVLALLLCALLLVGATIAGTVAYLTDKDNVVTNTFTVGKVEITMDEATVDEYGVPVADAARVTANTYKLVPGHTYTKDPTITVDADSENCFIFVKIDNGLKSAGTINMETGWYMVNGDVNGTSVWVYGTETAPTPVAANGQVTPFKTFVFGSNADPATCADAKIVVTAYAIQASNLGEATTPAAIWALF